MKCRRFLILIVSCWLILWSAGGCITGTPTTFNPPTTGGKPDNLPEEQLSDPSSSAQGRLLAEQLLSEVKPMVVAKYLGLPENDVPKSISNTVNPLSLEVARQSAIDESFVLDFLRPSRLPAGEYSWYGEIEFFVQRFGERHCKAECFYDAARGHWLLDQILVAEPIIYEGKPAHYLRPIEPSPGWKPGEFRGTEADRGWSVTTPEPPRL